MKYNHRPWSTPLVIASGLVIAISGMMLFFHLGDSFIKSAHEWIGMVMVAGIILHIHFHWRGFKQYFVKPIGLGVIALVFSVSAVLIVMSGSSKPHPAKHLVQQYSSKPLQQVAVFEGRPLAQLLIDLERSHIKVNSPELSLQEIARSNDVHLFDLLPIIFNDK